MQKLCEVFCYYTLFQYGLLGDDYFLSNNGFLGDDCPMAYDITMGDHGIAKGKQRSWHHN